MAQVMWVMAQVLWGWRTFEQGQVAVLGNRHLVPPPVALHLLPLLQHVASPQIGDTDFLFVIFLAFPCRHVAQAATPGAAQCAPYYPLYPCRLCAPLSPV